MRLSTAVIGVVVCCVSAQGPVFFSAAVSQGRITQTEKSVLAHTLSPGASYGLLTHW